MPRLRPHDRDRSEQSDPDRSSRSRKAWCAFFAAQKWANRRKDLLRACAREEIDVNVPFEELPKADQDFVIERRETRRANTPTKITRMIAGMECAVFSLARKQDLQNARARPAQPLPRLCHLSELQRRPLPTRSAELQNPGSGGPTAGISAALRRLAPLQLTLLPNSRRFDFRRARFSAHDRSSPNDNAADAARRNLRALNYLCEVGVGYLTLDRSTRTLERRRSAAGNLTTCLGASLVNTLFVMDEPSVGLHPRDVGRLVRVMHNLRDKGNTLLVVEHEEQIIRAADNLIDIGPGRGEHGGELGLEWTA
jgi:excinuclease ABC subunit A